MEKDIKTSATGKFPHKGRAGFLMRKKLAEEKAAKLSVNKPVASSVEIKKVASAPVRPAYKASRSIGTNAKTTERAVVGGAKKDTGWGKVAQWYHETVEDKGSYQRDLILPNVIRLLDIKKGETVLDLACGEGFFARRYANNGASVVGVDVASELIDIARKSGAVSSQAPLGNTRDKQNDGKVKEENPKYYVAGADTIPFVADNSIDKITIILALQNIENVTGVFKECSRVLKTGGKLLLVINHPAFRVPKASGWGWASSANGKEQTAKSGEEAVQYRRIDKYMSELREKIDMAPGTAASEHTISFHRPLQYFVKLLGKVGLAVINMEEWVGNRKSQPGPRAAAEDKARAEIPLFMMLEVKKI